MNNKTEFDTETIRTAESIVFKYYYQEEKTKEEVLSLLKTHFQLMNSTEITRLFNLVLWYLR
jgi:ornithine cyclodeaminase/alanine dehydrogenase-like protein (mu-crystallin family)